MGKSDRPTVGGKGLEAHRHTAAKRARLSQEKANAAKGSGKGSGKDSGKGSGKARGRGKGKQKAWKEMTQEEKVNTTLKKHLWFHEVAETHGLGKEGSAQMGMRSDPGARGMNWWGEASLDDPTLEATVMKTGSRRLPCADFLALMSQYDPHDPTTAVNAGDMEGLTKPVSQRIMRGILAETAKMHNYLTLAANNRKGCCNWGAKEMVHFANGLEYWKSIQDSPVGMEVANAAVQSAVAEGMLQKLPLDDGSYKYICKDHPAFVKADADEWRSASLAYLMKL